MFYLLNENVKKGIADLSITKNLFKKNILSIDLTYVLYLLYILYENYYNSNVLW